MRTSVMRLFRHAILVKIADLKSLWDLLATNYGDVKAVANCVDGSELHFASFDEIQAYENPGFRKIYKLTLSCGVYFEATCTLSIGDDLFSTCSLNIRNDADDRRALKVANEFDKRIRECRPFYWFIRLLKPTVLFPSLAFLWATVKVWGAFLASGGGLPPGKFSLVYAFYICVPVVIVLAFIGTYLDRAWDWMFPKVWFEIGRQESALKQRATVRHWVFGVVMLSIILGVIGNLLTNFIIK